MTFEYSTVKLTESSHFLAAGPEILSSDSSSSPQQQQRAVLSVSRRAEGTQRKSQDNVLGKKDTL